LGKDAVASPDDIKAALAYTREHRRGDAPFDLIHINPPIDPTQGAEIVGPYADAGLTWWLEEITPLHFGSEWRGEWPFEAMRERILAGPPK
jgi:hypothetical protein